MRVSLKEADVLSACLDYLRLKGVLAWRSNNTGVFDPARKCFRSFRGLKGVSDILGVVPQQAPDGGPLLGLLLAVECKGAGGSLSAEQHWFLEEVARCGGIALCVRSVGDLERGLGPYLDGGPPSTQRPPACSS
jgi:hypothetical protein